MRVFLLIALLAFAVPVHAEECPKGNVMADMGCVPLPGYKAGKPYKTPADLRMRLERDIRFALMGAGVKDVAARAAAKKEIMEAIDAYVAAMAKQPAKQEKKLNIFSIPTK